jgi:hypothetical protein
MHHKAFALAKKRRLRPVHPRVAGLPPGLAGHIVAAGTTVACYYRAIAIAKPISTRSVNESGPLGWPPSQVHQLEEHLWLVSAGLN